MALLKVKFRFILSALLVILDFVVLQLQLSNLYFVSFALVLLIVLLYRRDAMEALKRYHKRRS